MKPRNKREQQVARLSSKLPKATEVQESYAFEHCFKHKAIVRKKGSSEYFCLECGHIWTCDGASELADLVCGVECPGCHRHLTVDISRRRLGKEVIETFQTITTAGGFQVTRTYHVFQYTIPGSPACYHMEEVSQVWQQEEGKDIIIARSRRCGSRFNDNYILNKPMSLKIETPSSCYRINATVIYPRRKVLPTLLRNGYCRGMYDFNPTETFRLLWTSPHHETLAKAGFLDVWRHFNCYDIEKYWPQIKMLIRHKYHPSDIDLWKDTVRMAENLMLDTYSPKYILPADLERMHDTLMKRLQVRRRKDSEEKKRVEMMNKRKQDKYFRKRFGSILDVCIESEDISVTPLKCYEDYLSEGEAMHHCVETYWGRWDSLILSVRSNGKRLATVELDSKDFHIKQCRACCNEKPGRYDEILGLINSNIALFARAKKMNSDK